jgi:2-oxoglutarate ferredoxin oxidoreductase subunit delta
MSSRNSIQRRHTKFISLDTRRCEACWDCIEVCPKQVLGKIDMIWHRHTIIQDAEACNGCKKCVRGCETGALEYIFVPQSVNAKSQRPGLQQ